jgi:hypothetical protein
MKIILYSTSKSDWYQEEADKVAVIFGKKIPGFEIDVVYTSMPKDGVTFVDSDGDRRPSWDWLNQTFPLPEGYDGVGVHLGSYLYRRWQIKGILGSRHSQNKDYPFFWFMAKQKEAAEGYDNLSQFSRLLIHELSHFFEDLDDQFGNKLQQNSVHLADYDLKRIQDYPLLIDYRGWVLKRKVWHIINRVINLVRN